jgi:hypothetical protein
VVLKIGASLKLALDLSAWNFDDQPNFSSVTRAAFKLTTQEAVW